MYRPKQTRFSKQLVYRCYSLGKVFFYSATPNDKHHIPTIFHTVKSFRHNCPHPSLQTIAGDGVSQPLPGDESDSIVFACTPDSV